MVPKRPQRAREMQDGLNFYLYHPLAWQLARLLAKTPITPNMVSVIGGCFVVAAAAMYRLPWSIPTVLTGLLLHMTWHVVDGADGDLARLTGRVSPIGEMVDGICDYVSHIILYFMLGWQLAQQIGGLGYGLMWAAGLSHILQSNHVEVQRRSYQWWVYGTPWLSNSRKAELEISKRRGLLSSIADGYLRLATGLAPNTRRIDAAIEAAANDPARLEQIRAAIKAEAPPLLFMEKVLGPNPRAIVLGMGMLAGSFAWYCLYQAVVLNVLLVISVRMHNAAARRVAERIGV